MIEKFGLKTRMMLSVVVVVFIAFGITISFVAIKAKTMATDAAERLSEQMAYRYGSAVQTRFEVAMDATRTLAHTFQGIKTSSMPDRAVMDEIQKQILAENPDFVAVWTYWEPDRLDGKDNAYANKNGHDGTGRYMPYWNRGAGSIQVEPLVDTPETGLQDAFRMVKKGGKEAILEPYEYPIGGKKVLVTSMIVPITINGEVVGMTGVDIALTKLEALIRDVKPFDTGYGYIVSNNGLLVAHHKKEIIGKDFIKRQRPDVQQPIADAIKKGHAFTLYKVSKATGIHSFQVLTPITIGKTNTPWCFIISVPTQKVLGKAHTIIYTTILIGIICLVVLAGMIFFITKGMVDPMRTIIDGLGKGAERVASGIVEISSSSHQLADGSSNQAASIEETSSALEEMASMTRQNADNAQQADSLMAEAAKVVGQANESMTHLTTSMDDISKASEETSKIIKTIDEIAFQTNLLALNAAVEAARAGEAGAGFAVVADEVRNLAMRAAEAAKNTATLIEGTVQKVKGGSDLVNQSNEAFEMVAQSASKVGQLITEIATACNEQAQGIGQVNTSVAEMDKVTQQNAANAEESASAVTEMSAQAEQIKSFVNQLAALIGGGRIQTMARPAAPAPRPPVSSTRPAAAPAAPAPRKALPAGRPKEETDPSKVIPFDDDDFADF